MAAPNGGGFDCGRDTFLAHSPCSSVRSAASGLCPLDRHDLASVVPDPGRCHEEHADPVPNRVGRLRPRPGSDELDGLEVFHITRTVCCKHALTPFNAQSLHASQIGKQVFSTGLLNPKCASTIP